MSPYLVAAFLRPNPTIDWKPLSDAAYDPIWQAACDADLAIGFHPLLSGDIPGACRGLRINDLKLDTPWMRGEMQLASPLPGAPMGYDNHFFAQCDREPGRHDDAITFMTGGGVCQRFPELRCVFLEANGGWIVPWLERLDHHYEEFGFDVPWLHEEPSEHFRRQCWISFDPDESTLAFTASSPLVRRGPDRVGVRLPAPRREVPRDDARARRGDRGARRGRTAHDRGPSTSRCTRSRCRRRGRALSPSM